MPEHAHHHALLNHPPPGRESAGSARPKLDLSPLPPAPTLPRRAMSVTDAPLTSPEFAEALRAFCKDVAAQ